MDYETAQESQVYGQPHAPINPELVGTVEALTKKYLEDLRQLGFAFQTRGGDFKLKRVS